MNFAIYRLLALLLWPPGAGAVAHNWTITPTETIWRTRYTNCDKGYYVDLPAAVVAHDSRPPNPNHGFLISASNPQRTSQVTFELRRIVGVTDEYNSLEMPSARAELDWELKNTTDPHLINVRQVRFRSLPGVEASYRSGIAGKTPVTHELILFRNAEDLVYTIRLITLPSKYADDLKLFRQIQNGFQVFPISTRECVNP